MDIEHSTDEADVEEVVGGVVVLAKKWIAEGDGLSISSWINCYTDHTVGTDKKNRTSGLR